MRTGLRATIFAVAVASVGVMATADSHASQYPMNSTAYRKKMGDFIKTIRTACNSRCPPAQLGPIMAALTKMEFRVTEVCADGWVTEQEHAYVVAVEPKFPPPPPEPPGPHPDDPDD